MRQGQEWLFSKLANKLFKQNLLHAPYFNSKFSIL